MNNLNNLPYAEWLEQSLRNIVGKPVEAICIMTRFADDGDENGDTVGSGYWHCSVADKLVFAGFLQQDAMLDTMKVNGIIPDDGEDDEVEEGETDG